MDVTCPLCGENEDLRGVRGDAEITVTCGSCGQTWARSLHPACDSCGGGDMQTVPLAIVEKSRGTQLSVVGIRMVELCWECDRQRIARWQDNRPNPLLPDRLPTLDSTGD